MAVVSKFRGLALTLFVPGVLANHKNFAFTANNLALLANPTDA
jgi:hypothetical protein